MRIHHLQHVSFEGLGSMETVLKENGHTLTATHLYRGEPLPLPDSFDLLIVMGGPMGVYDEKDYPWLKAEKSFIRSAIDAGKKSSASAWVPSFWRMSSGPRSRAITTGRSAGFPSSDTKTWSPHNSKSFFRHRPSSSTGTATPLQSPMGLCPSHQAWPASTRGSYSMAASWPCSFTWKPPSSRQPFSSKTDDTNWTAPPLFRPKTRCLKSRSGSPPSTS